MGYSLDNKKIKSTPQKIACVYHGIDLDGWMSAAIVLHYYMERLDHLDRKENDRYFFANSLNEPNIELTFIAYNYGEKAPDLSYYNNIIMSDISFDAEKMFELYTDYGEKFIWIDHHSSAIKDVNERLGADLIIGKRNTKKSACELTWEYLFPDDEMPEIVELLGMYDSFRHIRKNNYSKEEIYDCLDNNEYKIPQAKHFAVDKWFKYEKVKFSKSLPREDNEEKVFEFQYGARYYINNYDLAYKYLLLSFKTEEINNDSSSIEDKIYYTGNIIYDYVKSQAKIIFEKAFPIELKVPEIYPSGNSQGIISLRKFLCVNAERFNPTTFGIRYQYDGFVSFFYDGTKWYFSIYTENDNIDVSLIAKQFGGGGHPGAAAFRIYDINKFFEENKILI